MTSVLDLNGTMHTVLASTTETVHQLVDTSAAKNGTLVIEAGAKFLFDDQPDAGFAADWVGTLTVTGSVLAYAEIASVDTNPHYPFTMALGATGVITCCRISGNGSYSCSHATPIVLNTVRWGYDTYCSVDDVRRLSGISSDQLSDADISVFIEMAGDKINDYTGRNWYTGTITNEDHDYMGEGFVRLTHYPVQSITTLQYRGGSTFVTKVLGADRDYYASPDDLRQGIVRLITHPIYDYQAVRATYIYGELWPAPRVRKLCMAIAAQMALMGTLHPEKASVLETRMGIIERMIKEGKVALGGKLRPWDSGGRAPEYQYPKGRVSKIMRARGLP